LFKTVLKDTPSDKVASPSLITLLDLLTSVPGIGEIVAVTLISSLPELGTISHKSISYLVGVAPLNKDSGKFRGKRRIWGGRAKIRRIFQITVITYCDYQLPWLNFVQSDCEASRRHRLKEN
jgi:transposase